MWRIEFIDEKVEREVEELPPGIRASFRRIARLIFDYGTLAFREPYIKHLRGPIWEIRLKGPEGIARALYVSVHDKRLVVVHVFRKRTQKTPEHELKTALKRAKEIL